MSTYVYLTKDIGEYRYQVFHDQEGYRDIFGENGFEFESEQERDAYYQEFRKGYLEPFYVEKLKKCECCHEYRFVDSLGLIISSVADEALKDYLENYDER